ncbi:hypothetical protein [Flavobacterium ginsenosidimutans]|uniref:hypothetical protein n=1 Tax=Flavobacterium ginsenosidimutans TaxID=687844 RepID=UPI000DAC6909|nr:hypothetical protein [Flavobacterium ginsenosidimutans]KAF2331741.1 hypothetical protein DM444_11100 [Flavobacterium ginsenosidimutans]
MKKFLCLLGAIAFVFTSCSKDDNDSSDSTSSILVKKTTITESDGSTYSEEIKYNGNKIVSITDEYGYLTKYSYTGDLITKMEEIDENGELDILTDYSYTNGKLTTSTTKETGAPNYNKIEFVHNSDGTVSYEKIRINSSTAVQEGSKTIGKLTFKNANLVKNEYSDGMEHVLTYEYDANNAPRKNITGLNLLLDIEEPSSTVNNVIKIIHTAGSGTNVNIYVATFTYKYNADNYPTEESVTFGGGSTEITQYFY